MLKRERLFILFFFIFILIIPTVASEEKYTREHAEELFYLINWYDYTPETFGKAIEEQKPILLVISAPAWCYWCHVYESEDYLYHPDFYPYINDHFIPIFVDSDKRPDLTRKYLEGGWPSTTIFTPNMQRITGFSGPRDPLALRSYFEQVIAYLDGKEFTQEDYNLNYVSEEEKVPGIVELEAYEIQFKLYMEKSFDEEYGGFVQKYAQDWREGQKFPSGFGYKWLLEQYEATGNEVYLSFVQTTFQNQYTNIKEIETRYRLYDPVEGGFHRYGTKRDWSIPHYEKMLYDQAKLLRAYAHLLQLTKNADVQIAVNGTISFVITKLTDKDGSFYASQDAYLEEEYYGLLAEEREKIDPPYIDKTRLMGSNAMMISTFLYLYKITGEEQYKTIAENALTFLENNMFTEEGAYYYFDDEKQQAFLRGQAVANAWGMFAFVEGYETLGDKTYLEAAETLASFSLDSLYDWQAGGFFMRNSNDAKFYAPNERIDLSKPYEENAVFAYSMLRLYDATGNLAYLEAGIKTIGYLIQRNGGFDETYYTLKAIELIEEKDLINAYKNHTGELQSVVEERRDTFWLADVLALQQEGISLDDAPQLTDEFTNTGFLVLAILAFLAGSLSFLSPCCFPVLTAYFAHNFKAKRGEIAKNTIFFFFGLALVFSLFGMGATILGSIFKEHRILFTQIAGAVIIVFGILEFFGKGFSGLHIRYKDGKTPLGSFLFGAIFAVGWSACIGPILASILLLAATTTTVIKGTTLLFIYAIGLAVPLVILSIYFDRIKNNRFWEFLEGRMIEIHGKKKSIYLHTTSMISGIILIIIGILIYSDYLYMLNQYALQSSFVQNTLLTVEESLKSLFL